MVQADAQAVAGLELSFVFDTIVSFNSIKIVGSANESFQTWKAQKSIDGNTWVDISNAQYTIVGNATVSIPATETQYFRLLGVSGSLTQNMWLYEFEFGDN